MKRTSVSIGDELRDAKVRKTEAVLEASSSPPPPSSSRAPRYPLAVAQAPNTITPATPGYEHLRDIIVAHCRLRGEIDLLFRIANVLVDEAQEKKFTQRCACSNKETERVFCKCVLLGRKSLSAQNPFPVHFSHELEDSMFAELLAAVGDSRPLLDLLDMDAEDDERCTNNLVCIYYTLSDVPRKYRELITDVADSMQRDEWVLSPRTADDALTAHDMSVLCRYSEKVLSFMQRAIQHAQESNASAYLMTREYNRYQRATLKFFSRPQE